MLNVKYIYKRVVATTFHNPYSCYMQNIYIHRYAVTKLSLHFIIHIVVICKTYTYTDML